MKVKLIVVLSNMEHKEASSKEAQKEYKVNPKDFVLECDSIADYGCPLGGVEPLNSLGDSISRIATGDWCYYIDATTQNS